MKAISAALSFLFILFIFSGCKDENNVPPVTPPVTQEPNSPVLLSPGNGVTVNSNTPQLDWDNFNNAASYRVQASLDGNINGTMLVDSTVTASSLTIPAGRVVAAVNIYWRVIANLQGGGNSNWSAIWRFKVIMSPPAPPVLVSPANNSNNIPFLPLFDWNESATAESYRLQVSGNNAFTQILLDQGQITASELQCPPGHLITGTQYFWRVNASNSAGLSISDWSTIFNFTTVSGPIPRSISGRITFADTSFVHFPVYYIVGAYSGWPPSGNEPDSYDTLVVQQQGQTYYSDFTILNLNNGSYVLASGIGFQLQIENIILGVYGCDTVHVPYSSCPISPTQVTIQNYNGVENINFLSWADSTKRIF